MTIDQPLWIICKNSVPLKVEVDRLDADDEFSLLQPKACLTFAFILTYKLKRPIVLTILGAENSCYDKNSTG